jgi:hypothetical protein
MEDKPTLSAGARNVAREATVVGAGRVFTTGRWEVVPPPVVPAFLVDVVVPSDVVEGVEATGEFRISPTFVQNPATD